MTSWGKQVAPDRPVLPEYPRPQMVRERWLNLNGPWDYAITPKENPAPSTYSGKILVPFPIESVLSQVNQRIDEQSRLWYRRTFQIPADWAGQRVLLHFGAVDWEAAVSVNGKAFPIHRGGYDGFSMDVTAALTAAGPQELVVSVWDPTEGGQPRGKQTRHPEGIFYTPVTGIWQTVWLEPVPASSIEGLKIVPDVDGGTGECYFRASPIPRLPTKWMRWFWTPPPEADAKSPVLRASRGSHYPSPPPHARLWWPDAPFLYNLRVTLKHAGRAHDSVGSYFGMRKISIGPDKEGVTRILLNNQFVLHNGVLDQGFWPDGLATPLLRMKRCVTTWK